MSRSPPIVTKVLPGRDPIFAMTSLDDRVYVVRTDGKRVVEVYDAVTLSLERRLPVPVSGSYYCVPGIAACSLNKCLYLSDWSNRIIRCVDLATDAVKKWRVSGKPHGLSVNGNHNVIAACLTDNKVLEISDGRLVRQICLPECLGPPWHAIQLPTGDYVVSHWLSPCAVSVVGVDGRLLRSYGPSSSSDVGPNRPRCLAVTKHGDILLAHYRLLTR